MPSVAESSASADPLAATLRAGVQTISAHGTVTFIQYVRVVLPLDGYVFWVRASLLSPAALAGAMGVNAAYASRPQLIAAPGPTFTARGSLHYSSTVEQAETLTFARNRVTFTALDPVIELDALQPGVMYIATLDNIRFAFMQRQSFYKRADLYHYVGDSLYPALANMVIDDPRGFDLFSVVVSNSLPIWLSLNQAAPSDPTLLPGSYIPLFPSFLIPANQTPPYASVHIVPEQTRSWQNGPTFDVSGASWQLAEDTVRVTLYGQRNVNALDFVQYVLSEMAWTEAMGISNVPIVRDDKMPQVEVGVIGTRKTIDFVVNYYQTRARAVALERIKSVIPSYDVLGYVTPPPFTGRDFDSDFDSDFA